MVKYNKISIHIKKFIIENKNSNSLLNNTNLVNLVKNKYDLKISRSAISKILKNKDKYISITSSNNFRIRNPNFHLIYQKLFEWINLNKNSDLVITDNILKIKANKIAEENNIQNFNFNNGAIQRFKHNFSLKSYKKVGESDKVDLNNCTDLIFILKQKLKKYDSSDIFNLDESALFYKCLPDKSLSNHPIKNSSKELSRITVGFICNFTGSIKKRPLIIHKFLKPRSFKNFNPESICSYYSNKNAWMDFNIFRDYILKWDRKLTHKILLIVDNASCHNKIILSDLINIELLFLPPGKTSLLQPLDLGIIRSFKCNYRKILIENYFYQMETTGKIIHINIKDAIIIVVKFWNTISPVLINNCFMKSPLFQDYRKEVKHKIDEPLIDEKDYKEINENIINLELKLPMLFEEYIDIEKNKKFNESINIEKMIFEESDEEIVNHDLTNKENNFIKKNEIEQEIKFLEEIKKKYLGMKWINENDFFNIDNICQKLKYEYLKKMKENRNSIFKYLKFS